MTDNEIKKIVRSPVIASKLTKRACDRAVADFIAANPDRPSEADLHRLVDRIKEGTRQ